jgi:hypothetical protein
VCRQDNLAFRSGRTDTWAGQWNVVSRGMMWGQVIELDTWRTSKCQLGLSLGSRVLYTVVTPGATLLHHLPVFNIKFKPHSEFLYTPRVTRPLQHVCTCLIPSCWSRSNCHVVYDDSLLMEGDANSLQLLIESEESARPIHIQIVSGLTCERSRARTARNVGVWGGGGDAETVIHTVTMDRS